VAGAGAYIGELNEGIAGRASPKDLETMFQLVYLQFTGARRDEEAFQSYLSTTRGWLENQQASPGYELSKQFSEAIYKGHPRRSMMTLERLDEVDLDRALAVFRDRFADASDFTFTLVGNFELDSIRPLIETWLGGLPAIDRKETWRDVGGYAERGVVRVDVHKGLEPQSRVQLIFHGDSEWSYERQHLLGSLASALRIRLREVLREDMGGVYGVGVSGSLSREPRQRYNVAISFSCDPGRVDELLDAVFREVEVFRRDGPPEDVLAKVKEAQRRSRETAVQQNQFWLSQLEYHQEIGRDFDDILHYDRLIGLVTKEATRELAGEVFDEESYALGVLYPEQEKSDG
jgi:zinc protease